MLTSLSGGKDTWVYRKTAGAIGRLGGLACGLLMLAGLGGAVPLAGQITPSSAASPGDWTWMSGSNTLGSGYGQSGVYGTLGTPNGTTNFPGGRWGAPSWIDHSGNLWLFGGFGYANGATFGYLNDLWEFNPSYNEWTWMGGNTTLTANYGGESPVYGTLGTAGGTNIPGGRQSASSWIDSSGNLWLFGGIGEGASTSTGTGASTTCTGAGFDRLNDLWEFNPSISNPATGTNGEWAWMGGICTPDAKGVYPAQPGGSPASGIYPGGRDLASSWTDSSGNFWLFGGEGYDASGNFGELNDLWEFNPSMNEWAWMGGSSTVPAYSGQKGVYGALGTFASTNIPGGRYGASSWTDSSGNFWLFGGEGFDALGNSGNLNDLWEFNPSPNKPSTNEWEWMRGSSTANQSGVYGSLQSPAVTNIPGGRYETSSWIDNSGNLWLFGGEGTGFLNDLWAFNPPTSQWVWMGGSTTANQSGVYGTLQSPAATNTPGSRVEATNWTDSYGNLWLFGGDGRDANGKLGALNDLWVYPPPTICWGPLSAIQISPATLSVGFVGESYFENFTATGGCGTGYTWSVTSGTALSAVGLSLTSAGIISGSPNAAETAAQFTVKVVDPQGNTATQNYTLTIYPDLVITPTTLPAGTVGTPYSQILTASGGPYTFTVFSGTALSAVGLSLSTTGTISGTPTGPETAAAFTVKIADSQGDFTQLNYTLTVNASTSTPAQVTDNETITVTDTETFPDVADSEKITVTDTEVVRAYNAITITPSAATFNANSGNGYATYAYAPVQFAAIGGIGTLTLTETGALPMGITFVNGTLSGTPATSSVGTYPFSVTATDADGDSVTVPGYTLTIQAASAYPAMVTDNETITVTDTETFPDVVDSEPITVTDTDTVRAFNAIVITPSPATFNARDGSAIAGASYGPVTFAATGGTGTLTLTESGTLPAGLTFTNGALGGMLSSTSAGAYTFSVTAADTYNDQTTVQGYTLNVAALPPSLTISANPVTLTIIQGQMGKTTLTFTPSGGYTGTLTLGCSGLPANTLCVFELNGAPPPITTVTLPGNNLPVSVALTIDTDVNGTQARMEPAPAPLPPDAILPAIAFWWSGSLLGLTAFRRKRKMSAKNQRWFGLCLLALLTGAVAAGLAGCGGGGFGTYVTQVGSYTVTVSATSASGTVQTLSIGITITQ